jgi:hypothetical protein
MLEAAFGLFTYNFGNMLYTCIWLFPKSGYHKLNFQTKSLLALRYTRIQVYKHLLEDEETDEKKLISVNMCSLFNHK